MPQRVNTDTADAAAVADAGEGADKVTRLDWPPRPGGEDQARVGPGRAEAGAVVFLSLATIGEGLSSQTEKRKIPAARTGLDRTEVELSLDALYLLTDVDRVAVDV